jgi:inhibitor of KinA
MSPSVRNPRIISLSEECVLVEFGNAISDKAHDAVMRLHLSLAENPVEGFVESVPAYSSIAIFFDPMSTIGISENGSPGIISIIRKHLASPTESKITEVKPITIPVQFGGRNGPDLKGLASSKGLTESSFIDIFTSVSYRVYMLGFRPGFPYMGEVPKELAAERLASPRALVPAGSLGIAGRQTGIYPMDSPGGWRIIGRSDFNLIHLDDEDSPTTLRSGDIVRFKPV